MSQTQELRWMFKEHGGKLTLGEIMKTYLGASYRQRLSDLRREMMSEGKTITCYPNREEGHKSETYWRVEDLPAQAAPVVYAEPSGQMAMILR